MRRADETIVISAEREFGATSGLFRQMFATVSAARIGTSRRSFTALAMSLISLAVVACAPGTGLSPAGAQDPGDKSSVTVPDDISSLDSDEVERRLGKLLGGDLTDGSGGQAAPDIEPTEVQDELTLDEILDLLNMATPVASSGEIVISISPETLSRLNNPVLEIKSPPSHGTATVMAPNQILYMPDGSGNGSDAFEYELFDGDIPVISQVVGIRR